MGVPGRRIDGFVIPEAHVQPDLCGLRRQERTHSAGIVAGQPRQILQREHSGFLTELVLELPVVHAPRSRGDHHDRAVPVVEGQGLGDLVRLSAQGLGRQLHRSGGFFKFMEAVQKAVLLKIWANIVNGHGFLLAVELFTILFYDNIMNTKKKKAAVIGALNVDIGGRPEAAFVPGDSIPGRVSVSLGGVGWNIARDCASLGLETSFFSVLGTDEHEAAIRSDAARFAVDLTNCRWEAAPNNRYLYISGKNGDLAAAVNDMRLCEKFDDAFMRAVLPALTGFDVIIADANLPPESLRTLADETDAPLVADGVSAVKCGRLRSLLPRLHTLKLNRMEAEMLAGRIDPEDCVRELLAAGVRRVVVSLSGDGVLCGEGTSLFRLPASGMPVTDATGAGDSLTAALAAGLAHSWDLASCAALGMQAAGITMGQPGAVTEKLTALAI